MSQSKLECLFYWQISALASENTSLLHWDEKTLKTFVYSLQVRVGAYLT
jgi:hypothetical protein